jgi:hypothetical protein
MALPRKHLPLPSISLLLGFALAAYYVAVFRPLCQRSAALDQPLIATWNRFAATNDLSPVVRGLNLDNHDQRLRQLQGQARSLEAASALVQQRIVWPEAVQAKLAAPWQLIDFQDERYQRIQALAALARDRKLALEAGATNGFPEYAADMALPTLLWPRLHMADQLLLTAVHCQVRSLRNLQQLPTESHRYARREQVFLMELPMRLELTGSMDAVTRFLAALPLATTNELRTVGVSAALTNKPPFFLGQLLVRKSTPEQPHEVQLEAVVSTFLPWSEQAQASRSSLLGN